MIPVLSALIGGGVVVVIVALLVCEGMGLGRGQKWSLCLLGGGLIGAAPGRFLGEPAGAADLMMLAGLLSLLLTLRPAKDASK